MAKFSKFIPPPTDPTYTITLSEKEYAVVLGALGAVMPSDVVRSMQDRGDETDGAQQLLYTLHGEFVRGRK